MLIVLEIMPVVCESTQQFRRDELTSSKTFIGGPALHTGAVKVHCGLQ